MDLEGWMFSKCSHELACQTAWTLPRPPSAKVIQGGPGV
jgi:hypothetical protein